MKYEIMKELEEIKSKNRKAENKIEHAWRVRRLKNIFNIAM